jgi:hypothetical protein
MSTETRERGKGRQLHEPQYATTHPPHDQWGRVKKGVRWSSGPARPRGREEPATAHLTCERRREGGERAYATTDYES